MIFYFKWVLSQKTPVVSIKQSLGCFFVSCLPSKINDIVVFLEKVEGFLSLSCLILIGMVGNWEGCMFYFLKIANDILKSKSI